jgi:hypothetical protein
MKISIKKKKHVDYDYQSINNNNKKKLAGVYNIIGVIHITFQYK